MKAPWTDIMYIGGHIHFASTCEYPKSYAAACSKEITGFVTSETSIPVLTINRIKFSKSQELAKCRLD